MSQLLHEFTYYVEDSDNQYFQLDVPDKFTAGKVPIFLRGSEYLQPNTSINIEILDANSQPVKYNVTKYLDTFKNRLISVHVDNKTARGIGRLTVVGSLRHDLVPDEWRNKFNVCYTIPIDINPYRQNDSVIHFDELPRILIAGSKIISKEISPINSLYTASYITESGGTVSYERTIKNQIQSEFNVSKNIVPSSRGDAVLWAHATSIDNTLSVTVDTDASSKFDRTDDIVSGVFKRQPTHAGKLISSNNIFKSNMIGGTFICEAPVNTYPTTSQYTSREDMPAGYSSRIIDVVNSSTAFVESAYVESVIDGNNYVEIPISSFDASPYLIKYGVSNSELQYITSSIVPRVTVEVQFSNFNPISGDVSRIKTYVKKRSSDSPYTLVDDRNLSPSDILVDSDYTNQTSYYDVLNNKRLIGHFYVLSDITKYWKFEQHGTAPTTSLQLNNATLSNSVFIPYSSSLNTFITFTSTGSYSLCEGDIYELSFRTINNAFDGKNPVMEIYMSGSAFINTQPPFQTVEYSPCGKFIGAISQSLASRYYDEVVYKFKADRDGYGQLHFRITSGDWYISRIKLKPAEEFGYTPNNFKYSIALPNYDVSSSIDFKFEYYNQSGRQSSVSSYINNILLSTAYQTRTYLDSSSHALPRENLQVRPVYNNPNATARLHEYNLNRNVTVINGVINAVKKSDVYTRNAYIYLLNTKSSSRADAPDDFLPPID